MAKDHRAKELVSLGKKLFDDKLQLDSFNQEIAWQFAPDLADFTAKLTLGEDWATERMDSFPEQVSRDLTNSLSAMLRPYDRSWFWVTTLDENTDRSPANAQGLERIAQVMRSEIYDPRARFIRSTKEADRFYVNFGQAVLSCEESPTRDHLLFRNFHIKNCAWLENELGEIDHLHRRAEMSARQMLRKFPRKNLDEKILTAAKTDPGKLFPYHVIVMPTDEYDNTQGNKNERRKLPFVAIYVDKWNERILREDRLAVFPYVVPRWHMWAQSQYAFSPATLPAVADARMAQMLSQILLESGEKAIDPPILAKQEVMIGEPNLQAGGISWVDIEHDETLDKALDIFRLEPDMRVGFEMRRDVREMLTKAFFLDKLQLPEGSKEMTAYEVSRRLEEHVRQLLPLFEPMQVEYNVRLLDTVFATLVNMKRIPFDDLPDELRGAYVTWNFETPIKKSEGRILVQQFQEALAITGAGMQAGASANPFDVDRGLRDAVRGIGGPAIWRKTDEEMQEDAEQIAAQRELAETTQAISAGGQAAVQVGEAAQKLGLVQENAPAGGGAPAQAGPQAGPQAGFDMEALMGEIMGVEPAQAQPAGGGNDQTVLMQRRILGMLTELEEVLSQPREVAIERDDQGRITSAQQRVSQRETAS